MSKSSLIMNAAQVPVVKFTNPNKEQNSTVEQSAYAFLLLAISAKMDGVKPTVRDSLLNHLRSLINGGTEPCCDAVQIWSYPALTCAITVCKNIPEVWDWLTDDEVSKLDTLMFTFALMNNFVSNDCNFYKTGVGLRGDIYKDRVSNIRFPLTMPIIAAAHYFEGSDNLDDMFVNFDYDAFIAKLGECGFINILSRWTTPDIVKGTKTYPGAKTLLTQESKAYVYSDLYGDIGNVYYAGHGVGVKVPYTYKDFKADDVGMVEFLVDFNHSGGACVSHTEDLGGGVYECYILDGSTSEAEGRDGMLKEYNASDPCGIRSSGHYCSVDFSMQTAVLAMLKALGVYDIKDSPLWEKVSNGAVDHFNKMRAGYIGKGMGVKHFENANNLRGHTFARLIWTEYVAK